MDRVWASACCRSPSSSRSWPTSSSRPLLHVLHHGSPCRYQVIIQCSLIQQYVFSIFLLFARFFFGQGRTPDATCLSGSVRRGGWTGFGPVPVAGLRLQFALGLLLLHAHSSRCYATGRQASCGSKAFVLRRRQHSSHYGREWCW